MEFKVPASGVLIAQVFVVAGPVKVLVPEPPINVIVWAPVAVTLNALLILPLAPVILLILENVPVIKLTDPEFAPDIVHVLPVALESTRELVAPLPPVKLPERVPVPENVNVSLEVFPVRLPI